MRKVRYEKSLISNSEKIFRTYTEDNVHYRRGLGLIVVKGQMENSLKNPFRSYAKPDKMASIMILIDCKATPNSARRFLMKKINMIETRELCSSPRALNYVAKRLSEYDNHRRFGLRKWTKDIKEEND